MSFDPLPPKLASVRYELHKTATRLHELADPIDEWTWGRSPVSGKWSIARCIEHLNITSRAYLPLFHAAFKDARARGLVSSQPSYRLGLLGWLLVKANEPPPRFRVKTPEDFVPPTIEPKEKVLREYDELQGELVALIEGAADLPLGKIKIASPFNTKVKYSSYNALRLIPAHQRRHLWQAEQVLAGLSPRRF